MARFWSRAKFHIWDRVQISIRARHWTWVRARAMFMANDNSLLKGSSMCWPRFPPGLSLGLGIRGLAKG